MAGGFPRDQVDGLLKACHRRCCICHQFCGVKIETDHIVPVAEGGSDSIDNAIPVCFDCHAEIHSYNDKHPRGRKFRPEELRGHKDQWLEICSRRPEIFINANRDSDVGPLQALIDELEFNATVADNTSIGTWGCQFLDEQFQRAIRVGAIATLQDTLRQSILEAYVAMRRANQHLSGAIAPNIPGIRASAVKNAVDSVIHAKPAINAAREALLKFLSSEV